MGTDFEEMMITKTMAEPTNIDITESLKEATGIYTVILAMDNSRILIPDESGKNAGGW